MCRGLVSGQVCASGGGRIAQCGPGIPCKTHSAAARTTNNGVDRHGFPLCEHSIPVTARKLRVWNSGSPVPIPQGQSEPSSILEITRRVPASVTQMLQIAVTESSLTCPFCPACGIFLLFIGFYVARRNRGGDSQSSIDLCVCGGARSDGSKRETGRPVRGRLRDALGARSCLSGLVHFSRMAGEMGLKDFRYVMTEGDNF